MYAAVGLVAAIRRPASAGPTIPVVWNRTWFNAVACGTSAVPTSRGVAACRAGLSIDPSNHVRQFAP